MKLTWRSLGLGMGLLALGATGCDDGLNFCTDRDDAGNCPDIPDFNRDGGMDATTAPPSDSSLPDGSKLPDGALVLNDASMDASAGDAAVVSYNVEDYCAAQYSVATAWRDKLEQCCVTTANAMEERYFFLLGALLYEDGSRDTEAVSACVTGINSWIGPNLTYVPTAAVACASRFSSQFARPDAACPTNGLGIEMLEATVGHGAQSAVQLPECRAAFVGKVALNGACVNSLECQSGLRCLGSSNSKTCRSPLATGNPCGQSSECADGLICQGSVMAGRSCQPVSAPVEVASNCTLSTECRTGLICPEGKCVTPSSMLFCAQ